MAKTKSNSDLLRSTIEELGKEDMGTDCRTEKMEECFEFLDAIDEEHKTEVDDLEDEKETLEEKLHSAHNAIDELDNNPNFEKTFLGLDTLNWNLDNGNLVIQQRMENFIANLQKEFSASSV